MPISAIRHAVPAIVFSLALVSHLLPAQSPQLQIIPSVARAASSSVSPHKGSYTVSVPAKADWVDTGIDLLTGETVLFASSGTITLPDGKSLTPAGVLRGWKDMLRSFPVDSANAGALVGRIGSSAAAVPFSIGNSATVEVPLGGRLYLRANLPSEVAATGSFTAKITFGQPSTTTSSSGAPKILAELRTLPLDALDQLPRRVSDQDGKPGDAVNYMLVGTKEQVEAAFARAGWVEVDSNTQSALLNGLIKTLQRRPYLQVPMSTLYLFNRPQDLAFARANAITVAAERHHLRCWLTSITLSGVPVWAGSATHDVGFESDERNGQLTHRIDPDIDLERDFIRDSFALSGAAASEAWFTPSNPVRDAHTATGGSFHSDGRIIVILLPQTAEANR